MPRPCLRSWPAVKRDASIAGDWSGSGWPQLTGCIHPAALLTGPNSNYEVLRSKFSKYHLSDRSPGWLSMGPFFAVAVPISTPNLVGRDRPIPVRSRKRAISLFWTAAIVMANSTVKIGKNAYIKLAWLDCGRRCDSEVVVGGETAGGEGLSSPCDEFGIACSD